MTDKRIIAQQLDSLIVSRLFACKRWLADDGTSKVLWKLVKELNLEKKLSDEEGYRPTVLGRELNIELLLVFMGMSRFEIGNILEENGLITESQADEIYDELARGADPEMVLRRRVQQAYFNYYSPSKAFH